MLSKASFQTMKAQAAGLPAAPKQFLIAFGCVQAVQQLQRIGIRIAISVEHSIRLKGSNQLYGLLPKNIQLML